MSQVPPQQQAPQQYAPAPRSSGGFGDFITFRIMITPIIIQILFWLGVAGMVIGGLLQLGVQPVAGVLMILVGPLLVRIQCEILLVVFKMLQELRQIRINTSR